MSKATVLVVDDDPALVDVLVDILEMEGYRALAALDGAALRLARDQRPDVVLLDLVMPGMDGAELSRRLRADPATAAIPIVVISAQNQLRTATTTLPVDDCLAKPFEIEDLCAIVARWSAAA